VRNAVQWAMMPPCAVVSTTSSSVRGLAVDVPGLAIDAGALLEVLTAALSGAPTMVSSPEDGRPCPTGVLVPTSPRSNQLDL
jgi:hypothetical protein